jgi:hypothetical protein
MFVCAGFKAIAPLLLLCSSSPASILKLFSLLYYSFSFTKPMYIQLPFSFTLPTFIKSHNAQHSTKDTKYRQCPVYIICGLCNIIVILLMINTVIIMCSSHEFHVKKKADRNSILNTYTDILKMYT